MRIAKITIVILSIAGLGMSLAKAQDKIGIPACDEFFAKYEACMTKIPAAQQGMFKGQMDQMRTAWKAAAANTQTKDALQGTCTQMTATVKTSMAQYGCQW